MLDMATRETPRMQRSGLRLGDQLFDERPQLLGLRFRRLDRAALDQRLREAAHERELLFTRATELPSRLSVTHCSLLLVVWRSSGGATGRGAPIGHPHALGAGIVAHPEIQPFSLEEIRDLLQRLLSEILHLEHLRLCLTNEITEGADVGVLERVHRADGQLQLVERRLEERRQAL